MGKMKVQAVCERLGLGLGIEMVPTGGRFDRTSPITTPIVISAVDSMAARIEIFEAFKASETALVFLDGRMGSRYGRVFLVDKRNKHTLVEYQKSLHSDAEGHEEPCTAKATIFCAYALSGLLGSALTNWIRDERVPVETQADFSNFVVGGRHADPAPTPSPAAAPGN
jgi:hypothetical protein